MSKRNFIADECQLAIIVYYFLNGIEFIYSKITRKKIPDKYQ